jgi:D-alanyl-D-alanine carboxypeptidase/D-alanyl-D-alanine-endopeptidase (penicillin-binding protein 4)
MDSERLWRGAAIVLCAAVPVSFYALGDIADAFPGVLTTQREEQGPAAGPAAVAEDWERTAPRAPRGSETPMVPTGTAPAATDLAARMAAHADLPVVAGNLAFSVVDAETGTVLAEREAAAPLIPASTQKLLTAAAVLRTHTGDEVLTTAASVQDGAVTLIGGGDMTLQDEDLRALARQTVALAAEQGLTEATLTLDASFLEGGQNSAWGDNGTAGGWVAPTAALALNGGMLDGEQYGPKSTDPAGDAARRFAELLAEEGLEVVGEIASGQAPAGAPQVEVHSAPLGDLVRHTLLISDNTTAELLAHLVALSRGEPATPEGAAQAVQAEIEDLGIELGVPSTDLENLQIHDGSGLSRQNRVPPALLAAVLAETASGDVPRLEQILYDVPIAGLSGTLAERFDEGDTVDARGQVRGKTGYLGGAATLAGVAVLPDGRTVGYSIVVHGFDGADAAAAREAVDQVAAELVQKE